MHPNLVPVSVSVTQMNLFSMFIKFYDRKQVRIFDINVFEMTSSESWLFK